MGRPEATKSDEWRRDGDRQRNVEEDCGSDNGPKWPRIRLKIN